MYNATAIILAGGRASRMDGVDKAQLKINSRTLLDRSVERMRACFEHVLIVTNSQRQYDYPHVTQVVDQCPDCGPLMGLYTGLNASPSDINFVMACDMPYLSEKLVSLMLDHADGADVVVPVVKGFREPLLAVYRKSVIPFIQSSLDQNQLKIISFYDKVKVLELPEEQIIQADPELLSFININTPHDLTRASQIFNK